MSLLSLLLNEDPFAARRELSPFFLPLEAIQPLTKCIFNQLANLKEVSPIVSDENQFQANIDVQQFKPEEISVRLSDDNVVIVEAKHEEKQDEHGYISRHFVRKYELPEECDVTKLQSKLSSDGVLSISAPKRPESKDMEYKQIPIIRTGPIEKLDHQTPTESDVKKG